MIKYGKSIANGLNDLLKENDRTIVIGEDIRDPYGGAFKITKGLSRDYTDRVINTPISEAAIVGMAGGLAVSGFFPIVEIMFGDFITLCADQIINHITKFRWMYNEKLKYSLMIRTPMGGRRGYGPTHSQSLEKIFFGIPNIVILAPSLVNSPSFMIKEFVNHQGVTLFIENKFSYGLNLIDDSQLLKKGFNVSRTKDVYETVIINMDSHPDITMITYGGMVPFVIAAAEELFYKHEIVVELVIMSKIIPVDLKELTDSLQKTGKLIIVEEGSLTGGWGSEVAALVAQLCFDSLKASIKRVASCDMVIGSSKVLEDRVLTQKENIMEAVLGMM
jgi:pyruvate/2-oxoglutarate/acetoin dehydrogenase E1 component